MISWFDEISSSTSCESGTSFSSFPFPAFDSNFSSSGWSGSGPDSAAGIFGCWTISECSSESDPDEDEDDDEEVEDESLLSLLISRNFSSSATTTSTDSEIIFWLFPFPVVTTFSTGLLCWVSTISSRIASGGLVSSWLIRSSEGSWKAKKKKSKLESVYVM